MNSRAMLQTLLSKGCRNMHYTTELDQIIYPIRHFGSDCVGHATWSTERARSKENRESYLFDDCRESSRGVNESDGWDIAISNHRHWTHEAIPTRNESKRKSISSKLDLADWLTCATVEKGFSTKKSKLDLLFLHAHDFSLLYLTIVLRL